MSANGHFVSLRGVTKRFGDHEVLHEVDLDVDLHNVVCLIGASGSGKSTLLRCINLLEQVDAGTIVIDGETITERQGRREQRCAGRSGSSSSPTTCSRT